MSRSLLRIAMMLVFLTGCQSVETFAVSTPASSPVPPPVITQTPTIGPAVSVTDSALSFTFPPPAQAAVSIWRPPLYETPWALGPYDHFFFTRPISVDEVNWPLADYRYGYFFSGTSVVHTGIDVDARRGTDVLAAGSGEVVWAGYGLYRGQDDSSDPYGLAVTIQHDFGYQGQYLYTVYGHMDKIFVKTGQQVRTGEILGRVGNTGKTTGPHLHFEVRLQENSFFVSRNPELWLAPPEGWGVLVGRIVQADGTPIRNAEVSVRSLSTSQVWQGRTYGPINVNSDDYYLENFVLSDLPEGEYMVAVKLHGVDFLYQVTIRPGAITYFTYRQKRGFNSDLPDQPESWDQAVQQPIS